MDNRLARLRAAFRAYDAEQKRIFGDVVIVHSGRAGRELQEVLDSARELAAPTPADGAPQEQEP